MAGIDGPDRRARRGIVTALLGLGVLVAAQTAAGALPCELEFGPARSVVKVIDGETLALDGGSEVRLIGALAPRALDGAAPEAAWPLEAQATAALEQLALGKSVDLGMAGRRTDRYGRLLAQVFVRDGDTRTWLQGEMLRSGHARAYALPGSTECLGELVAAELPARERGIGVWAHAAYQVRPAYRTWALSRFRSTYQIVEGRVLKVDDERGGVFLNFGPNWRNDFTMMVRPSHKGEFEQVKLEFKALEGQRVRVRGWIERRAGPMIEIYHPAQVEVLTD